MFCIFIFDWNSTNCYLFKFFIVVHIKVTQFFYTATFLGTLISAVGSSMFFLCSSPDDKRSVQITFWLGITLIVSGNSTLFFYMYFFNLIDIIFIN